MPLFELPLQLDDHTEGNSETVISFLTGEEAWGSQEHQAQQKQNGTSPLFRTISATEQKTFFSPKLKAFWTSLKRKGTFINDVIIPSCQKML